MKIAGDAGLIIDSNSKLTARLKEAAAYPQLSFDAGSPNRPPWVRLHEAER